MQQERFYMYFARENVMLLEIEFISSGEMPPRSFSLPSAFQPHYLNEYFTSFKSRKEKSRKWSLPRYDVAIVRVEFV